MHKILISACLLGENVKYNGENNRIEHPLIKRWQLEGRLIAICPEKEGGLPVPRDPVEIQEGEGADVLEGRSQAKTRDGHDLSSAFLKGAGAALMLAAQHNVKVAILKEQSPSCGCNRIYDGTFTGSLKPGMGITARLLEQNGIHPFSENQLDDLHSFLQQIE